MTDAATIAQALAAPFDPGEVKFKPQTVSGNRALAIAFVDARVIQDRLDEVLGVMGWQDSYERFPDGSVVCRLRIRLGTEWITKEDVGSQSEQPDEGDRCKAAFSDALKRAAVKFGIGRYLYRCKPQWVDYDPQKRQFLRTPALPANPETVPLPQQMKRRDVMPANGKELLARLQARDEKLVREGICRPGDLLRHVVQAGKMAGLPSQLEHWDEAGIGLAVRESRTFLQSRRSTLPIGTDQYQELERLLTAKGEDWRRVVAFLGLPADTPASQLTQGHYERVRTSLEAMPDVGQPGGNAPLRTKAG